jgi:hypothetical protein
VEFGACHKKEFSLKNKVALLVSRKRRVSVYSTSATTVLSEKYFLAKRLNGEKELKRLADFGFFFFSFSPLRS